MIHWNSDSQHFNTYSKANSQPPHRYDRGLYGTSMISGPEVDVFSIPVSLTSENEEHVQSTLRFIGCLRNQPISRSCSRYPVERSFAFQTLHFIQGGGMSE